MTKETMGDVVGADLAFISALAECAVAHGRTILTKETALSLLEVVGRLENSLVSRPAPSEASGDVVEATAKLESIWIQWSDCGNHIRRWQRTPFDGGEEITALTQAPQADALREAVGIISDWLDYGGERGLYDSGKYLDAKIRASAFLAKQARTLTESQTDAD